MKTTCFRVTLFLLLCSVPLLAEGPRAVERDKPLFVDGVQYEGAVMEQFKDQANYWVVEKDAIYGFTTPEGVAAYGQEKAERTRRTRGLKGITSNSHISSSCSGFNKNVGCGGIDWLVLCPLSQYSMLPDSWNDVISCVETGSNVGYYTVIYKCYNFSASTVDCYNNILWIGPGVTISDLIDYGRNNYTSSIRFCSNVNPFTCTQ